LSIRVSLLLQRAQKSTFFGRVAVTAIVAVYYLTEVLPGQLPGDFEIDYSFLGVMLPVMIWAGKGKWQSLGMCALGLLLLATGNSIQIYALAALIPLAFYNGQRGKHHLKAFFYWYYPIHLIAIYGVKFLLDKLAA